MNRYYIQIYKVTMPIIRKYAIIKTNVKMKEFFFMKRHDARQKALQVLFQLDNTELELQEAINLVLEGASSDAFLEQLVEGTISHKEDIDSLLTEKLEKWSLARLPKIERTVLRLAVYELIYMEDTPQKVVLNEAVELCKLYGDEKSSKFVNGVLSKFTQQ